MLIVLGVNIFPSAIKDVVSSFYPSTTGELQILLDQPGPAVKPPLRMVLEFGTSAPDLDELKNEVEAKIRSLLNVQAAVKLVAPGTLPKFEMKGQLVQKAYED